MEQKTEQEYLEMLKEEFEGTKEWQLIQAMLAAFPAKEVWDSLI